MRPKYLYIKDLTKFDKNEYPKINSSMLYFYSKYIKKNICNRKYCVKSEDSQRYFEHHYWINKWLTPVTKKNFYTIAKECRNEIQELHTIAADLGLEYPQKITVSDGSPLYDTGIHSMECVR